MTEAKSSSHRIQGIVQVFDLQQSGDRIDRTRASAVWASHPERRLVSWPVLRSPAPGSRPYRG
jgi:hypothetical protein